MELIIFRDSKEVGRLRLSEGTFSIGRGLQNTIALDEQDVSRRHAKIHVQEGRVLAEDLGSENGTFLHGKPLQQKTELDNGDILEVGPYFIQAILDDEFVSHAMERTESHATLKALERSTRHAGTSDVTVRQPGDAGETPHAGAPRQNMDHQRAETGSSSSSDSSNGTSDEESSDDSGDWLAPHELFGLSEDSWLERSSPQDQRTSEPQPDQASDSAEDGAPSDEQASKEDGVLIPMDDVFPSEEDPGTSEEEDEPDDIELVELIEAEQDSLSEVPTAPAPTNPLDYDDWSTSERDRDHGHRLRNTLNLAEQEAPPSNGLSDLFQDQSSNSPMLVAREGFAKQEAFILGDGTFYLGRADEMDIVLLDTNASRRHAAISREPQGFIIRDLWSLNGIEVNGQRVESSPLHHGDRIRIGDTVLEFLWPEQAANPVPSRETVSATSPPDPARLPPESGPSGPSAGKRPITGEAQEGGRQPSPSSASAARIPSETPESPASIHESQRASSEHLEPQTVPQAMKVPRRGRSRKRHSRLLSPTFAVVFATATILLVVVALLVFRRHPRPTAQLIAPPSPNLPLDALNLVAKAKAELAAGEYQSAIDSALLAQAIAPMSMETTRLVQHVCEASATNWMEQRLKRHIGNRPLPETTPEVTPPPEVADTPVPSQSTKDELAHAVSAPDADSVPPVPEPSSQVTSVATHKPVVAEKRSNPRATRASAMSQHKTSTSAATDLDRRVAKLYQEGLAARDQGRYLEAVQAFEKAKAEDTFKQSELYYTIQDEVQRAMEQLHEVARPLVAEATRLENEGRLTEARQKLADAVSKDPYYTPAVTRLRQLEQRLVSNARQVLLEAQAKEKEGDIAGAVTAYRKVLALAPDPSNVYHQTATRRLEQLE